MRASYASRAALVALYLASHAIVAQGEGADAPTVTPYRPTVSNPADLPVPGWFEFETGGLHVHGADGMRTDTLPWLLKYAFNADSGLLLGGNAYDRLSATDGSHASGFGDTLLEWKQRFALREGVAFGIEAGVDMPTAARKLGVGKPAWLINGIFSTDLGASHLDLNLGGTRYTLKQPRASLWQGAWAAALSHPLGETFGVAIELSGTAQRGAGATHQVLGAINYNLSRRVVFDFGAARNLDRAAHDRSLFAGGTFLLGKFP
ncbi:MAG: transporter [Gammaproteobacteria bacterium]|nr:MAG: transporter [Gammaproteobacteria bacterium]